MADVNADVNAAVALARPPPRVLNLEAMEVDDAAALLVADDPHLHPVLVEKGELGEGAARREEGRLGAEGAVVVLVDWRAGADGDKVDGVGGVRPDKGVLSVGAKALDRHVLAGRVEMGGAALDDVLRVVIVAVDVERGAVAEEVRAQLLDERRRRPVLGDRPNRVVARDDHPVVRGAVERPPQPLLVRRSAGELRLAARRAAEVEALTVFREEAIAHRR